MSPVTLNRKTKNCHKPLRKREREGRSGTSAKEEMDATCFLPPLWMFYLGGRVLKGFNTRLHLQRIY